MPHFLPFLHSIPYQSKKRKIFVLSTVFEFVSKKFFITTTQSLKKNARNQALPLIEKRAKNSLNTVVLATNTAL
jgi:hypothetical protein